MGVMPLAEADATSFRWAWQGGEVDTVSVSVKWGHNYVPAAAIAFSMDAKMWSSMAK